MASNLLVFDNEYFLTFEEMMDAVRHEYAHGDRQAAMDKLSELQTGLSGF